MPTYVPGKLVLRKTWQPMDPDAAAYITAVEAADTAAGQSGGLEEKTKIAIDNFVLGCKADGIWTAIKASCILAGARTRQGALVPLRNEFDTVNNLQPAPPAVAGTAEGWNYLRKTGLQGNGTDNYIDSNRNNSAETQDNQHLGIYQTGNGTISTFSIGARTGVTNASQIYCDSSGWLASIRTTVGVPYRGTINGAQFVGGSRSGSSSYLQRTGKVNYANNNSSAAAPSLNQYVFGLNTSGSMFAPTSTRLAFYSIGESLDLTLLDARVTDLITAIGVAF